MSGTRKTTQAFDWVDLSKPEQTQWAAQYLWREAVNGSILLNSNETISPDNLSNLFTTLRRAHQQPERNTVLKDLDRRMRRAWDEIIRRNDPNTKAYQFRMSRSLTGQLGWLRKAWNRPISTIVEELITEAYSNEKTEVAKSQAIKSRDKNIARTSKRLLKLETDLRKSKEREKALEKLTKDLTLMVCTAEHKLKNGMSDDARLDPESTLLVDSRAKSCLDAYLESIEAELRQIQHPDTLSPQSEKDMQDLERAMPKP